MLKKKKLETFHVALLINDNILLFDGNFSKVPFFTNQMGIFSTNLDKINLDHNKRLIKMILKLLFMSDF